MISQEDRLKIIAIARRYNITRILLFGSSADPQKEGKDIDLAVEGVSPSDFFKFYGELLFSVSKPVDLIDISNSTKFNRLIRREGTLLYG